MISRLKIPTLVTAFISISLLAVGQDTKSKSSTITSNKSQDIIISQKGDNAEKMTIIVDGDKVTINGKPVDEFNNKSVTVRRRSNVDAAMAPRARTLATPPTNFRMFNNDGASSWNSNKAVLGVTTSKTDAGAKISEITKESGAEKAGLQKNDVITKAGSKKIETPEDLIEAIAEYKPNDKVEIVYLRDGKENKTSATLAENKIRAYSYNINPDINFNLPYLDGLNFNRRPKIGLQIQDVEEGKGVTVKDVDEDSPASKAGIKEGDVVTQIDGKEMAGVDEVRTAIKDLKEGDTLKLAYKRGGKMQTTDLKIPKKLRTADL